MSESTDKGSQGSGSGSRGRPVYYGGNARQMYYGASHSPMYYGGGGSAYGGGAYGGYSGGGAGQEEESMMGAITIGRLLRVCQQRWITIAVFVVIGALAAFAVFKMSPTIYEASSVFEMSIRRPRIMTTMQDVNEYDQGTNMEEIFNTRVARLRTREFFLKAIALYRTDNPSSTLLDEELVAILRDSKLTLQRRSRLVVIAMRSTDPDFAAALANLYLREAEIFTKELNAAESETAIQWINDQVEIARRDRERADKNVLEFRLAHNVDLMTSKSLIAQQTASKLNVDILMLEAEVTAATLVYKTLELIKDQPEKFGSLPEAIPRAIEISRAYQAWQDAIAEKNVLLSQSQLTANHPEVRAKEARAEDFKQQFADSVFRSLETSKANLDLKQRQLDVLLPYRDAQMALITDLALKIEEANMKLGGLVLERNDREDIYQALLRRMREAQYAADEKTATIRPVEPALPPRDPVLPQPLIIFTAGPMLGFLLGILFVLMIDHLEDKIVGISDIEQRIRLKTLVVLPHVRRMKREQIARLVASDKFSQFAEAIASLRNLLDSPRYAEMSKVMLCVSTQPGEGKTITSSNLAISCALSGEKTLLIDFDMRRPRIARIFEKEPDTFTSLPHILVKADPSLFPSLPTHSNVENLDLVCSKASSEISPASLMGSGTIVEFFKWARDNYDRVIVDSPPFGVVGDVMSLSSLVDSVMVMCCPNRTRFNPLKHAARYLAEAGARVIGVVVNDVDFERHRLFDKDNYHYKYAYQYGKKYSSVSPSKRNKAVSAIAIGSAEARELADEEEGHLVHSPAETDMDVKDRFDASMVDDDE